jgi:hypothetical protein
VESRKKALQANLASDRAQRPPGVKLHALLIFPACLDSLTCKNRDLDLFASRSFSSETLSLASAHSHVL